MKNKCCLIVPYFGKLPNYFELFLKSCAYNPEFIWMIFTDDHTKYNYPSNVHAYYMEFHELLAIMSNKFDFTVNISEPHKLCDFKPSYGYIFEEYLREYDFWGFCDLDVLWGNLKNFITDDLLEKYDKLFCLGHFVLFRNNKEINRLFMQPIDGEYWYKDAFTSTKTIIFDETVGDRNINTLFLRKGKRVLMKDYSMNSKIAPANFVRVIYNPTSNSFDVEKKKKAVYLWDRGNAYRLIRKRGRLIKEEFMYYHFQGREMNIKEDVYKLDVFKILGDGFYLLEYEPINEKNFYKVKKTIFSFRFFRIWIPWKINGLKRRINKILEV